MNVRDSSGRTMMHWLACGPSPVCVKIGHFFLSRGMDPNALDAVGSSVLHYTASLGKVELARFLVECGVCVFFVLAFQFRYPLFS